MPRATVYQIRGLQEGTPKVMYGRTRLINAFEMNQPIGVRIRVSPFGDEDEGYFAYALDDNTIIQKVQGGRIPVGRMVNLNGEGFYLIGSDEEIRFMLLEGYIR